MRPCISSHSYQPASIAHRQGVLWRDGSGTAGVLELAAVDVDRDFEEQRVDHEAERPDACGDFPFGEAGAVFDDLVQGAGDEGRDDHSHAFFDPEADKGEQAGCVKEHGTAIDPWLHEEDHCDDGEHDRGPDPRHQLMMAVQAKVKILRGTGVAAAGVELDEDLRNDHEQADEDGDADDAHECADGSLTKHAPGLPADDLDGDDDKRRAADEGASEEARGEQRGVPKGPTTKSAIKEGGDGVDADGPDDAQEHGGHIHLRHGLLSAEALIKQVAADIDVDGEIAVQHDDIPGEHGDGEVKLPEAGHHVPEAVGPAEIAHDEHDAHDDGGDGEQLADDDDVVHLLVMIKIGRDDHHDSASGQTDEEGEIRDVEAPGDVVAHGSEGHAITHLDRPGVRSDKEDGGEQRHPHIELPATLDGLAEGVPGKTEILLPFGNGLGGQRDDGWITHRRSRRIEV